MIDESIIKKVSEWAGQDIELLNGRPFKETRAIFEKAIHKGNCELRTNCMLSDAYQFINKIIEVGCIDEEEKIFWNHEKTDEINGRYSKYFKNNETEK